jgi:hypothetical protein
MIRQIGSQYQEASLAALEERVHLLEAKVALLARALTVLASGLEGRPLADPGEREVADAARAARDLLAAGRAAPGGGGGPQARR